jgi:hypothetical protein
MSIISIDVILLSRTDDGSAIRTSTQLAVDKVGASTREGVRLTGNLKSGANQASILTCREPPAVLRPGILYCPFSRQTSEPTRTFLQTFLLPSRAKSVVASTAVIEDDESEGGDASEFAVMHKLMTNLKRLPLEISKQIETYPKLVSLVKRLSKLEIDASIDLTKLASQTGRIAELKNTLTSLEAWESVV